MATKRKWHPDHYQTHPQAMPDESLHRQEVRKLRKAETAPLKTHVGGRRKEKLIHAGEPLEHDVAVVCARCEVGHGFSAGSVVTPCPNCRFDTYRVVS